MMEQSKNSCIILIDKLTNLFFTRYLVYKPPLKLNKNKIYALDVISVGKVLILFGFKFNLPWVIKIGL